MLAYRHVEYSRELWWTFAFDANAPRALRATLVVVLFATAFLLLNLLQPARPEPAVANRRRHRSRPQDHQQVGSHHRERRAERRQAPAVQRRRRRVRDVSGERAKLDRARRSGRAARQVRRAGVALPRAVGSARRAHGVLSGARRTAAAVRRSRPCGVEDRRGSARTAAGFFARRPARAGLRSDHRRAARGGASFEIVPPDQVPALLPALRKISDAWLADKSTAEKRFSVGAFTEKYVANFPIALVRTKAALPRSRTSGPPARRTSSPSTSCASAPTRRAARWTTCSSS